MLMWSTVLPLPELCGDVKNARLRRFVRKTFEYLRASRKRWIVINSWQNCKGLQFADGMDTVSVNR